MSNEDVNTPLQPTRFQPTESASNWRIKLPPWWQWIVFSIALAIAIIAWFLLTATAVRFESNAENASYEVSGGFTFRSGPSLLMRPGQYLLSASADGFMSVTETIDVLNLEDQTIEVLLEPLPGWITIEGIPEGARISLGDEVLGNSPLTMRLPAGEVELSIQADEYQASDVQEIVIGRETNQTIQFELAPNWADVILPTTPSRARVSIDGELTEFLTPGPIRVPPGEHTLSAKLTGYERWSDIIYVEAGESHELQPVSLTLIGGGLSLTTNPPGASITVNGKFAGTSPLDLDISPNENHRIEASLFSYQPAIRNVTLETGQSRHLNIAFKEITGTLNVTTDPDEAEIWVDGNQLGLSNTLLSLHAVAHTVELRKSGYAGFKTDLTIQPNFPQELKVKLLTHEEARLESLKQVRLTTEGQELVLIEPSSIRMGASRRQPGRRSNEVFRSVNLSRLFYMSKHEVTNEQFRAFASGHDSGEFENVSLNKDEQPAVNVSWIEVARYCNWLSEKEGFEPFYILRPGDPAKYDENSLGYRMPTEAEWAWVARYTGQGNELLHFPWGAKLPPPNYHGNYADRAAQHVIGRVIFNYNDNHTVSAPVGTFDANYNSIYDLGGNVSEWIHNFYEIPKVNSVVANLGPEEGEYHVIRGSSWMHGTITDLRLSFRDYGTDGRRDVGFRLARFAE